MPAVTVSPVKSMLASAGTVTTRFGKDTTGLIAYQFNLQGFRGAVEYDCKPSYAFFGCSLVFGIGVHYDQTFAARFKSHHNYGLAGSYNNDDIYAVCKSFCNQYQGVKMAVVWTDRHCENLDHYSQELSGLGFCQFFCGKPCAFDNCWSMPAQIDFDVSGTHMGPKSHAEFYQVLCSRFDH